MRYLILSDIHGNLHALDAVLADATREGYDQAICLGDLVGYGADPGGVIDRILALAPVAMIRGNHDKVAAGIEPPLLFNELARKSIEWTAETITPAQLEALQALPKGPRTVVAGLEICHGAPFDEDYDIFEPGDAARAMDAAVEQYCLFGHTHLPALFATSEDPICADDPGSEHLRLPETGPALINVGSVGQPRDGDPRAAYGIIDLASRQLVLRRIDYDLKGAQARIIQAGLPPWLAVRLEKGV